MIELIRHIGDAGSPAGAELTEQIQVNLDLRVVRILHVIINEQVRDNSRSRLGVVVNRKHFPQPPGILLLHSERMRPHTGRKALYAAGTL